MKKLASMIMTTIFFFTLLPVSADVLTETNVSLHRPGFAYRTYKSNNADYATDGDLTTGYRYNSKGRYHVDLGAGYTIKYIKMYLPDNYTNYKVYLTNQRQMSHAVRDFSNLSVVKVADTDSMTLAVNNGYAIIPVAENSILSKDERNDKYQFVCVAHEDDFIINEIEVYTDDSEVLNDSNGLAKYWVEIAGFKSAFSTTVYGEEYAAYNANDRGSHTGFLTDTSIKWQNENEQINASDHSDGILYKDMKQRLVIDLGAEFPIHAVVFRPAWHPILSEISTNTSSNKYMGGFGIYGTNDTSLSVGDDGFDYIWGDAGNVGDYNYHKYSSANGKYRYIVVESTPKIYSDKYYYHALGICDLLVYTDTESGVAKPDLGTKMSDRAHLVSKSMPAYMYNGNGISDASSLVDGDILTYFEVSDESNTIYTVIDLGKPQTIDYVALLDCNKANYATNSDNIVYVTNESTIPRYESQRGDEILLHIPQNGTRDGIFTVYSATDAMKGKKYRYVVYAMPGGSDDNPFEMLDSDGSSGGYLSALDIYAKESNFHEVYAEFKIEQGESNLEYTVNADKFYCATNEGYKLFAAAYGQENNLISVSSKKINVDYGKTNKLSDYIRLVNAEDVSYVKVMLWDNANSLRPVVEAKTFVLPEFTPGKSWLNIYVSPSGSDEGDGTEMFPFKTLYRAQEEVRKYNSNMQGNITVNLMPGRYELNTHIEFGLEDSGTNGYEVIWQGTDPDNLPIISGAKEINGTWTEGEDGIWHVKADSLNFAREMFVNNKIAVRAQTPKKIYGGQYYTEENNYFHPHYGEQTEKHVGFYVDKSKMGLYENPEDIEIHSIMKFRTVLLHVDDIIPDPNNENQVIVKMDRNFWNEYHIASANDGDTKQYPAFTPSNGFVVENAYELLDEPGEFYFNKKTKILSYIPREGENLNTAEILIPQNEQLIFINGGNVYNRVNNIRFSNIQFAHTTSFEMEESNITGGQAEYHFANNTPWFMGRSSILMDWAENVNFEGCVFYGLSGMGLHHRDGVYNCDVIGNVFADIGATAFCAGTKCHDNLIEIEESDEPRDVAWHAPWSASYHYWPGTGYTYQALNTQRYSEKSTETGKGWYSEPWAKDEGTYPYLMVELEKAYSLEKLQFSFPKTSSEEERSNFEVLISSDRDFKEYETLMNYTDTADFNETVNVDSDKKYRYIMFRKTVPGPFCMNGVWAWSFDRMFKGNMGVPMRGTVSNNYFMRPAQQKQGSYPIWLNWTREYEILHNTIDDAPYSGISVGWGWDTNQSMSAGDNKISYNRINNVMSYMDDGAGIYVLGKNYGTELLENYITNSVLDGMAIYFDQGTAGVTADGNVSFGTNEAFNLNTKRQVVLKNSYTGDIDSFDAFGVKVTDPYNIENSELEYYPITTFSVNNPPEDVIRIMANAGVEEQWRWIEDRIPAQMTQRVILIGPDASDARKPLSVNLAQNDYLDEEIAIAESILSNGTFGPMPWHFDLGCKAEIEYWLGAIDRTDSRSDDYSKAAHIEEQFGLKDSIWKAYDSVVHPSYDEMLLMCNSVSEDKEAYFESDIIEFLNKISEINASVGEGRVNQSIAVSKLERLYESLMSKSNKSQITAVYAKDSETVIDGINKNIRINLPFGTEFSDAVPVITTSLSCGIDEEKSELNFTDGKGIVALYNVNSGEYTTWTIEMVKSSDIEVAGKIPVDANIWTGGNPNVIKYNTGDSITIEPWFQPTMNTQVMNGYLSFSLKANRADTTDGINVIFSAKTSQLEATTFENKNTYYMATIKNQTLSLYKVNCGKKLLCANSVNVPFDYDTYNEIEIFVTEENTKDIISIIFNGQKVLDASITEPIGKIGYFGILTKNMPVKIK